MIVTESFHEKRLKNYKLNIITKYLDNEEEKIRYSNNSKNDDVNNGIRLNKKYIIDDKMLLEIKEFNPRILYSYVINEQLDKDYKCKNCGAVFNTKDTTLCPYCRTNYNIDYTDKSLSARYHYDQILRKNSYIFITLLIDVLFCFSMSFIYFINTGRTFTIFDFLKASGFGLIFSLLLFYVFLVLDALIISIPVKMIKDKENKKKIEVWNELNEMGVDKKELFNNFNCELERFFYQNNNQVVDYDILDYEKYDYKIDDKQRINIKISVYIRMVEYQNNKLVANKKELTFILRKNEVEQSKLNEGVNLVKCHNCGNSIDVTKDHCDFCKTPVHYLQSWYIVK